MRGCVFDTPHSQVPRSPGLPQYSTGPQRSSSTSSRPLAAELPKPPPWKLRGTDPCVPVLGQEVVVGSREAFHYVPSALETAWTEQSRVGQICELAKKQTTDAGLWLNYSQAVFQPTPGVPSRDPGPEEAKVLSYFLMGEDKKPHWIEPLSGIARNPHSICMKSADLFDIRYLILESFCGRPGPKPIVRFFDLGCTSNAGTRDFLNVNYQQGSGAGPSIPLFFNMYKDRCLEFDHIYGWEAKSQSVSAWWEPLPDHIRERVRYYNVPVNENSCEETLGKDKYASKGSFLRMLPHAAKVEDFVVLKVDIDGGPELQIVESIARHPELSALVDEIFFEYHFYFDGIGFGWPPVTKDSRSRAVLVSLFRQALNPKPNMTKALNIKHHTLSRKPSYWTSGAKCGHGTGFDEEAPVGRNQVTLLDLSRRERRERREGLRFRCHGKMPLVSLGILIQDLVGCPN